MVKKTEKGFICEPCKLAYKKEKQAQACEDWCNEHKTCNIAVTSKAINKQECSSC